MQSYDNEHRKDEENRGLFENEQNKTMVGRGRCMSIIF
jgi:hypothetical protein